MGIRKQFAYLSYKDFEKMRSLKSAFDALGDHVIITDKEANILYANKAVEQMTGFPLEEVIGKNPGDLWGGRMPQEFYEKMWHTIKIEKKPFVGEVRNVRKNGKEYWQELHISPVLNEKEEVQFFIGIEPNITDRKEKERFREEFTSILAHQLRNPLSTTKWTLELLFTKGGLTEDQHQVLYDIYKNNQLLMDLVGDLLIISRAGEMKAPMEKLDLASEIEVLIEQFQKAYPRVTFSFEKEKGEFPLYTNKSLISQVFLNLISNAAQYADKAKGEVKVVLWHNGEAYLVSIENNGLIILPEDQPGIFTKFFRGSNAKQGKEIGTGLGLFITKLLCDHLGGKISFQSPRKEGDGAIFFVRIPLGQTS